MGGGKTLNITYFIRKQEYYAQIRGPKIRHVSYTRNILKLTGYLEFPASAGSIPLRSAELRVTWRWRSVNSLIWSKKVEFAIFCLNEIIILLGLMTKWLKIDHSRDNYPIFSSSNNRGYAKFQSEYALAKPKKIEDQKPILWLQKIAYKHLYRETFGISSLFQT